MTVRSWSAHVGANDSGALTAFDAATGAVRWRWTGDGPAVRLARTRGNRGHPAAHHAERERGDWRRSIRRPLLWRIPFTTSFDQNSITPVVVKDLVIYSGLESGTTAVRIIRKGTSWAAEPVWKNEQVSMYMSSPVVSGGTLFGLSHRNRGQFFAIDLATGKTLWTTAGREGENASIMVAGGVLLLSTTNGELIVARASLRGSKK